LNERGTLIDPTNGSIYYDQEPSGKHLSPMIYKTTLGKRIRYYLMLAYIFIEKDRPKDDALCRLVEASVRQSTTDRSLLPITSFFNGRNEILLRLHLRALPSARKARNALAPALASAGAGASAGACRRQCMRNHFLD
jgi:hypothetical protein